MRRDSGHIEFTNVTYDELLFPDADPAERYLSDQDRFPTLVGRVPRVAAWAAMVDAHPDLAELDEQFPALGNPELPFFAKKDLAVDAVDHHQVVILVGPTGSGKSTQMPQALVERGYKVVQSQPRRMAARMVAERMQFELNGTLGAERAAGMVGHQTAESCTLTDDTRISVITDGIQLMKQLNEESAVAGNVVYMLDEVHEWGKNTEFTIGLIKQIIAKNPAAKFVLSSATMDSQGLADFFKDGSGRPAPVIEVPGRTHPIDKYEKPESTMVDEAIASATENPTKDMLLFVPGTQEIADTIDAIRSRLPEAIARTATILPLHSKMSSYNQDLANQPTEGLKIIVATNVAQTSLTLDGIEVVIDSGLRRNIELDDEGAEGLYLQAVSRADCDQRAGRTGRVGPGTYILTRYNERTKFMSYDARPEYPPAEIWHTNLDREILRLAAKGKDVSALETYHHVKHEAIERAKEALFDLGALDDEGNVTELGKKMDVFPVRPTSARMLMEALPYSDEIRAQLSAIAAVEEVGGLQYFGPDVGKAWKQLIEDESKTSDLFAQLDIFIAAKAMTDAELIEHDLDVQAVHKARELYDRLMRKGELDLEAVTLRNPTALERTSLEHAIYAGLISWVYEHQGGGIYKRVGAPDSAPREFSNRSVVEGRPRLVMARPRNVELVRSGKLAERKILERLTVIQDVQALGRVAAQHLVEFVPEKLLWRNGVVVSTARLALHGTLRLGNVIEMEAVDTPETFAFVRDGIIGNPGAAQRKLRDMKNELKDLQRLTLSDVPQLTQEDFLALIDRAIKEAGVYDQNYIDKTLGDIMEAEGLTIESFLPEADQVTIRANAPGELIAGNGVRFPVTYTNGMPVITRYDVMELISCPDNLYLQDGREVKFKYGSRHLSPVALRAMHELAPA